MKNTLTLADWQARAAALKPVGLALINGTLRAAASGATFDNLNPANGRTLGVVAACDAADVDAAVASARAVFERGDWSQRRPVERKRVWRKFAELIRAARDELALLETLDIGKPIRDSLGVDVSGSANCIEWYAESLDKMYDEVAPTGPAALATITRELAAIVPFGGFKQSGIGRDKSLHAFDKYTELKSTWLDLS